MIVLCAPLWHCKTAARVPALTLLILELPGILKANERTRRSYARRQAQL
jgi:hypothetical protein